MILDTSKLKREIHPMPVDVEERLNRENLMDAYRRRPPYYPVYTFIAPSQLHRFIELLKASGIDLEGKFATQITTSKHFYDVTAHKYIEENCKDLGMKYIKGLSADMDDLLKEEGQKAARDFFSYVCWCIEHDIYELIFKDYRTQA